MRTTLLLAAMALLSATIAGPAGTTQADATSAPVVEVNVTPALPVREHGGGDELTVQVNLVPLEQLGKVPAA